MEIQNAILEEIFMIPSQTVLIDRFTSEKAACSGHCTSGRCQGSTDLHPEPTTVEYA
jgi:hypothetical protein